MTKEADEILKGASDYASGEFANSKLSDKHKDLFVKARTARRIRLTGASAAEEYYKKAGRNFDDNDYSEVGNRIAAMILLYAIIACLINLILYLPVYYLLIWVGINRHDAVYITVMINTAISTIATGINFESTTRRKAFIAGMHAEADNHIVGNYHEAKNRMDRHYASKGDLPDDDLDW